MIKYTQKELRAMVRGGYAKELTAADIPADFDRVGYASGVYGIAGGLIQDRATGQLWAIIGRKSLLFRVM